MSIMNPLAIAKAKSGNRKIGDAATTYAAQQSCPSDCVFKDGGGCYAETGVLAVHATRPLNMAGAAQDADAAMVANAEAAAIDGMDVIAGRPMRLHTVGDCASDAAARIVAAAAERYMGRGGGQVWTYTHAWRNVSRSSWGDVSVLASCETPADVLLAQARGYAPSIVVDEFSDRRRYGMDGIEVLPCPSMTSGVTCSDCRLCFDDEALLGRGYAIGFEVHGTNLAVKKAKLALSDPGDPRRKLTSRDFIESYRQERAAWPSAREVMDGANVTHGSAWEMLNKMKEAAA